MFDGSVPDSMFWLRSSELSADIVASVSGMDPTMLLPTIDKALQGTRQYSRKPKVIGGTAITGTTQGTRPSRTYLTGPVLVSHCTPAQLHGFVLVSQPHDTAFAHCVEPGDVDTNRSTRATRSAKSQFT